MDICDRNTTEYLSKKFHAAAAELRKEAGSAFITDPCIDLLGSCMAAATATAWAPFASKAVWASAHSGTKMWRGC